MSKLILSFDAENVATFANEKKRLIDTASVNSKTGTIIFEDGAYSATRHGLMVKEWKLVAMKQAKFSDSVTELDKASFTTRAKNVSEALEKLAEHIAADKITADDIAQTLQGLGTQAAFEREVDLKVVHPSDVPEFIPAGY